MKTIIELLTHSSIKITCQKVIYVDPFNIKKASNDADVIFITHEHFDHFSPEDIHKIKKPETVYVAPQSMKEKMLVFLYDGKISGERLIAVEPGQSSTAAGVSFEMIPAYNNAKHFHPKEAGWAGYVIDTGEEKIYIAGDTDVNIDNQKIVCDTAMLPVDGTYTMDYKEAAELANLLRPKLAIPTHYGSVAGDEDCGIRFMELVDKDIRVELIKQY